MIFQKSSLNDQKSIKGMGFFSNLIVGYLLFVDSVNQESMDLLIFGMLLVLSYCSVDQGIHL